MTPTPTEREFAVEVVRRLREAGHEALWAGGCVRDELLGLTPKDYDVATSALPEQVRRLFRRTVAVGEAFGVIEVLGPRTEAGPLKVQVATFRSDGDLQRRPAARRGRLLFAARGRPAPRLHHQRHVLRPAGESAHRLRRRPGRPATTACSAPSATRQALRRGQAAHAAGGAHGDALRADHRPGHRRRHPRRWRRGIAVVSAERIADELRKMLVDRTGAGDAAVHGPGPGGAGAAGTAADARTAAGPAAPDGPALPPPGRRPTLSGRPATCGTTSCACWTCSATRRRFRWPSPPCCTTSASRAPSAGRRSATPSTATSTSAAAWRRKSACA